MSRYKQIQIDVEIYRAIETHRTSFTQSENDILRGLLVAPQSDIQQSRRPPSAPKRIIKSEEKRKRGNWKLNLRGKIRVASNMTDAYRLLLVELQAIDPTFLERFSREASRSRRFVARKPSDLYARTPQLAADYGQLLLDGWYFDTNLSWAQVLVRAQTAARISGLDYGSDVELVQD